METSNNCRHLNMQCPLHRPHHHHHHECRHHQHHHFSLSHQPQHHHHQRFHHHHRHHHHHHHQNINCNIGIDPNSLLVQNPQRLSTTHQVLYPPPTPNRMVQEKDEGVEEFDDDEEGVEEFDDDEEEDDPVFVLTDEWKEFFAKSEAKRKLEKKLSKKKKTSLS